MASLTQTTFDAVLKEMYPDDEPENVATKNRPFLRMVPKKDDFEGDNLVIPVQHEFPMGRSATFATAQTNASPGQYIKWNLVQKSDYANITIDALTIRSSRSKRGAFLEARKAEIDGMLRNLGRSASISLYGSGSGSIGQISSFATDTITLTDADDTEHFGVNQVIVLSATDGGGTVRAGTLTVASRDPSAGTVTFTVNVTTGIAAAANNDFIFTEGDYDAKIVGLAGWLPLTSPSATAFFGVDRSVDPERLGGNRLNTPAASIEENILTLAEKIVDRGGEPDVCFINHTNFSNLVKGLGSKVEYQGAGGEAAVGFRSVMMHTSAGTVNVFADPDCPGDLGYVLTMSTWMLHHLDGFPHIDTIDGNSGLRQASSDGIEIRARYWAELGCSAPGWNGVFSIS